MTTPDFLGIANYSREGYIDGYLSFLNTTFGTPKDSPTARATAEAAYEAAKRVDAEAFARVYPYGRPIPGPVYVTTRRGRSVGPFNTFEDAACWADTTIGREEVSDITTLLHPDTDDAQQRN